MRMKLLHIIEHTFCVDYLTQLELLIKLHTESMIDIENGEIQMKKRKP